LGCLAKKEEDWVHNELMGDRIFSSHSTINIMLYGISCCIRW